jgi:hypothetical protein
MKVLALKIREAAVPLSHKQYLYHNTLVSGVLCRVRTLCSATCAVDKMERCQKIEVVLARGYFVTSP